MKGDNNKINKSALDFSLYSIPRIKEICNPLQTCLRINCFGYLKIYNDCSYLSLMNGYENYLKKYFQNIKTQAPSIIQALRLAPPNGTPHLYLGPTKYAKLPPIIALHDENNIWYDFSIIYRNNEYCEMFWFAFNKQSDDKTQFYFQNSSLLVKFANHFKIQAADLINDNDKSKIALYPEQFDLSYKEDNNIKQFIFDIDKNFSLRNQNGKLIHLTKREFESLKLISNNKTVKEAAQLLDLSPRTVEAYINNLKLKLGVNYKNQLVEIFNNSYY